MTPLDSHKPLYNADNWQASIRMQFSLRQQKTRMTQCHHYGPLRVQRPFYPESHTQQTSACDSTQNELAHIYLLHPPGGVVGGDQLSIELKLEQNSQVLLTTPGSGKFYYSPHKTASLQQRFHLDANASLEWLPQENILFRGARLHARSRFYLHRQASLIAWDITCLGRPSNAERFDDGLLNGQLEIYIDQSLVLVESSHVFDAEALDYIAGLRSKPIQASLFAYPANQALLETVREFIASFDSHCIGATLIDDLLVIRALDDNTEHLKNRLIDIWTVLRPAILKRTAQPPRIWST